MNDDATLEAIRQKRLQELASQYGGQAGGLNPEQEERKQQEQEAASERRQAMLMQVLQPQARERLARIALVKPEKARGVEDIVLQMAQRGQLVEKVSEAKLIQLLEQLQSSDRPNVRVTIQRRQRTWDDE